MYTNIKTAASFCFASDMSGSPALKHMFFSRDSVYNIRIHVNGFIETKCRANFEHAIFFFLCPPIVEIDCFRIYDIYIIFFRDVDMQTGYKTKTILCMPIYIRGRLVGFKINYAETYKHMSITKMH